MSVTIKSENSSAKKAAPTAEEKEYEAWARDLASRPAPQIGNVAAGGGNFLNPTSTPTDILPSHSGFDIDSAIGRFTWHTIGLDKYVPCVFRNGEKYCCVRMVEASIMMDLLNILPQEIYDAANLNSHFVTPAEAKLLTYINSWHCDGFYGSEQFTTNDLVVSLIDMEKFYLYLTFAHNVLQSGGQNKDEDFSRCGFVRVNNDSLIPYTVLSEEEKGVPLFYFEGQTDILKEKAQPLMGWELAYLKVCCKVQGVRKDLIMGPSLLIVRLSDLKAYFPKRTIFTENCWPPPKAKSLLPKQTINGMPHTSNRVSVSSDKWTKNIPNENFANYVTTASTTTTSTSSNSSSVVNGKNGGTNVVVNVNGHSIPVSKSQLSAKATNLAKIKAAGPPVDHSRLLSIPEHPDGARENAYVVRLIIIEKELMHCINTKPYKTDGYLLVLQEFMNHYFPTVSIYPTAVGVLKNIGITTHIPNSSQIRVLNAFGFSIQRAWEMPLIPAAEAAAAMPKLRHLFRTQHPQQRTNPMQDSVNLRSAVQSNGYISFQGGQAQAR